MNHNNTINEETFKTPSSKTGTNSSDKNYSLYCDYLNLSLRGKPNLAINGLTVTKEAYGTKVFENRFSLVYNGENFGTLLNSPRSAILAKDINHFKLENHLFYTMPLPALAEKIDNLLNEMGLIFHSVNRLDVALDFIGEKHHIDNVLTQIIGSRNILISGRKKEVHYYTHTVNGVNVFTGCRVGSRTSARFMRLYNKTEESKKVLKDYINKSWKENGLTNGDVWRMEYQMNSKFFADLPKMTIKELLTNEKMYSLFTMAKKNHFELRHNTGKSQINQEQPFNLFDWSTVETAVNVAYSPIEKLKRIINESMIGQQRIVKSLLRSYFSSGQQLEYILPLKLILNDFNLWEWYTKRVPFYITEFKKLEIIKQFDRKKFNQDLAVEI